MELQASELGYPIRILASRQGEETVGKIAAELFLSLRWITGFRDGAAQLGCSSQALR